MAATRTVRLGSMAYVDPDGRVRRADCGAEVQIHPDHVERFDQLNVLQEPATPAPREEPAEPVEDKPVETKRRPGRPRKTETES